MLCCGHYGLKFNRLRVIFIYISLVGGKEATFQVLNSQMWLLGMAALLDSADVDCIHYLSKFC